MTGCTVHVVTNELDAGPIVAQAAVPVLADDTVASLARRILVEEHRARHILETVGGAGEFDSSPGTGIAFQIDVDDATGRDGDVTLGSTGAATIDATSAVPNTVTVAAGRSLRTRRA